MKTIELLGHIDAQHRLSADVPVEIPPGQIRLALIIPGEADQSGAQEEGLGWAAGVAHEWRDELADPREDVYTLSDGEPVDEAR